MLFMRCLSYTLSKAGKAEIMLKSEQLQAVHHMNDGWRDVYAV